MQAKTKVRLQNLRINSISTRLKKPKQKVSTVRQNKKSLNSIAKIEKHYKNKEKDFRKEQKKWSKK